MFSINILKILCCLPVIIIACYFIPFVGVCLIIARYFVYINKKYYSTAISLISIGILIVIPNLVQNLISKLDNISIPYLNTIINSEIYPDLLKFSKFIISVGVVFLVISIILKRLLEKLSSFIQSYINAKEIKSFQVSQKNDMEMKIKREKAKNTQVVYCPYCGADNILTEKTGTCKYCRRNLNNE